MIIPKKQLCQWNSPEVIAKELVKDWGESGLIWLDGDGTDLGRWVTLAADPIDHICCRGRPQDNGACNPFNTLKNLDPGHWTGWLSYEAGAWIEPSNPWKADVMATLWVSSHDPIFRFDLKKRQLWIEGCNAKRFSKFANWIENIPKSKVEKIPSKQSIASKQEHSIPINSWQWLTTKESYAEGVKHLKKRIEDGDIFQANLSACCVTAVPQNILAFNLFQKLRKHCPAPFSGIVIGTGSTANEAIISASPERFLKVLPNGDVETRPIKGTRPRHNNPLQDATLATDLVCSTKDRAENIMIVDLLRNDLGKVCTPGSINVPQLIGLESYQQVHHLTSVVKGCLHSDKTWIDLLKACWPGGSISGAPKLRACQRLYELEPTARGPYCGSLIHLDWDGTFDSNILIRSLFLNGSTLRANAGCGIVADSDPDIEANELSWKLMPLLEALA